MESRLEELEELLADYFSGKLSDDQAQRLNTLLDSDPSYRKRYEEMSKVRAKLFIPKFEEEKQANYEALTARLGLSVNSKRKPFFRWGSRAYWVAAAGLFLMLLSVSTYYTGRHEATGNERAEMNTVDVPFGSRSKVHLPDGTTVCLKAGSTLKYSTAFLRQTTREVYLTGEGYFDVTKDAAKPFIVHTRDLNVRVLGTVFNVRSYADDSSVRVTLIEGRVNVSASSEKEDTVGLFPHEWVVYERHTKRMRKGAADAEQAVSWLNGKMEFADASFGELIREIERVYNVKIRIESREAWKEVFSGSIDSRLPVDEVLEYIDVDNKYEWSRKGDTIILRDKE